MDNPLVAALMKLIGQGPAAPPPDPNAGINPDKPWESVSMPPSAPGVPASPSPTPQLALPPITPLTPGNAGGAVTPSDQALIEALRKQQINQAFAGGTGNPMPR